MDDSQAEIYQKRINQLEKVRESIISTVSHELRTPLTSILGYTSIVNSEKFGTLNPQQKEFLKIVEKESQKLANLIDQLVDTNRIDTGKIDLEKEECNIREIIENAIFDYREDIQKNSAEIKVDVENKIVSVDPDKLKKAVKVIISNAMKFSKDKSKICITSEIIDGKRSSDKAKLIRINVKDNCPKIPQEEVPELFDPFRQKEHYLTRTVGGMGLGLTYFKKIIELHNGSVFVHPVEDGNIFCFSLPIETTIQQKLI